MPEGWDKVRGTVQARDGALATVDLTIRRKEDLLLLDPE